MSYSNLEAEVIHRALNDDPGTYLAVEGDADGLDLVEIYRYDGGQVRARITMPYAEAVLLHEQLGKYLNTVAVKPE